MRKLSMIFVLLMMVQVSYADVPYLINLQGYLADDTGPVTGDFEATFRIYNDSTGGTVLWSKPIRSLWITVFILKF